MKELNCPPLIVKAIAINRRDSSPCGHLHDMLQEYKCSTLGLKPLLTLDLPTEIVGKQQYKPRLVDQIWKNTLNSTHRTRL